MKYYSTNNKHYLVDLKTAVTEGIAPDQGLYMPASLQRLPPVFFQKIADKTFREISFEVAKNFFAGDIGDEELKRIVDHTISFDSPLAEVEENVFALELFHGPTLAFKDFGARFMSQLLGHFAMDGDRDITILAATSGDTGSAVANGFLDVPGTRVVVLYPKGKVSDIQEKQFTTLGKNITALEIGGTFDDCQRMVKSAFHDADLRKKFFLTSANSINIARLIPQSFYYFHAFAQLKDKSRSLIFSVPSGNFGNLTAGVLAYRMGLPVKHFVAATNVNDIVPDYLKKKHFNPRPSVQTISNAMDVGNPSNFHRLLDQFNGDHQGMSTLIKGYSFTDDETAAAIRKIFNERNYLMDPHGAIGYSGLQRYREDHEKDINGIFLETAHPGKFREVVEKSIAKEISLPDALKKFQDRKKLSVEMPANFNDLKKFLLHH